MSKEIQIFNNSEFGQVRVVEHNGEVMFVATDVAVALGYEKPNNAVNTHCKKVNKFSYPDSGQLQPYNVIPESDVYRLIMRSHLPSAERFQDWLVEEVLPAIRKHGGYLTPAKIEDVLLNPDTIIRLATDLKEERRQRQELEAQVVADRPKVLFADAVSASTGSILIRDMAKIIKQNGVPLGERRLYALLREKGLIVKNGTTPTQKAMEMGLFEIQERAFIKPDGNIRTSLTSKVTGKGQSYFVNTLLPAGTA